MSKKSYEETYTHPEMREEIKKEMKASDKGGEPGQWSARKSQLLKQEYEKRGGGYKGEKTESQRNLTEWTQEEWQTKEGDANAREGGETARYLPKEAWERMSDEEAEETDRKKREASKEGQQYVGNTSEAKSARGESLSPPIEDYDELNVGEVEDRLKGLSKDELQRVRDYEKGHANRKTLLQKLDREIQSG